MLDCIKIEPASAASASVIWCHGLGADGNDFVPIVDELGLPADHGLRFVFPHAPFRQVSINNGMVMRAWYDISGSSFTDRQDDAHDLHAISGEIETLIADEIARGIPCERIVLAGFSQGGAIALHSGVRHPQTLAGIMALSAYLPQAEQLGEEAAGANRDTPIFMAHGSADPVVPLALGMAGRNALQAAGYNAAWHEYPMQHQVCPPLLRDIGHWLATRVPV